MKKKFAVIVVVLTLITLSIFLGNWYINRPAAPITYSGTIEGTELPVQPELGGRIVDLPVREGQAIKVGDVVAKLEDDQAKISLETAKIQQTQAQASLDQAQTGNSQPTIKAQKAAVDIVAQSVKVAELALSKLTIKSPTDGQVLYKHVELGQVVNPGTTLVTILDPNDLWIKVFIPEAKLNQVKVGGTVFIAVDSYPNKTFKGQIQYVSDQAEFTPKNVQTQEERTTTVYAVKINITEGKDQLKAGMPADVTLQ
jgi:HlyD family secretion protein